MAEKTLYIIDGHAQMYRAYYAPFGNLTAPSGEPTRATHVFFQMVLNLLRDRRPDYLLMVMDVSDETVFRKEIFADYKAHRDPAPEDLPRQIERIVQIAETIKLPILRKDAYEADDLIATLVKRHAGAGLDVFLVSKDKDLEQLINPHVALYDPGKDEVIDEERLVATKGWPPALAIEAQILCGDNVDNIPGVKGIGPKTAAKLLEKYGSAQAVIDHADELTPKQRENVREFAPLIEAVRQLVTLRNDLEFPFELEAADVSRLDWSAAVPIFQELGLRRLIEQMPAGTDKRHDEPAVVTIRGKTNADVAETLATDDEAVALAASLREPVRGDYTCVNTPDALRALREELAQQSAYAIDTETVGKSCIDAELVGISLSWAPGRAFYIPTRAMMGDFLPVALVREQLGPLLANPETTKVGHHIKYDLLVLGNAGLPMAGPLFDTMIAGFVLDPARLSYKLDRLVQALFGHEMIPITDLIGKGRDQITMDQVPLEMITTYAAEDADYTWRLHRVFAPQLRGSDREALFYETEMPLVSVLAEMERNGISLNVDCLREMSCHLAERVAALSEQICQSAGQMFNLDSPKQLAEVLFDKLGFRVIKRTKTARSTDADTLETLARESEHALPRLLLEYRELQKLRSTYVDALPQARAKRTGRVHTSYQQTGAITGRLSSTDPNLQNIPVRTELGRQIRRAFVPRSTDERLIVADYSQIELRILAHFSEDEALLEAFRADRDIHAVVAAQVNGVGLEDVTPEMRGRAKAVNFGIIYGQTAFGLAQGTGMSRSEAQAFIDGYFARYGRIRDFINRCIAEATEHGYVRTALGRRRPIREITSRNRAARAQAERLAVNTVIQGSAADLIKTAMINLQREIVEEGLALRMLLQVHDELVCEAPVELADSLARRVRQTMAGAMELRVPLRVDVAVADNWLEAK